MILGYLLIDKGGSVVLEKDLMNLVDENQKPYFTSLVRVVVDISKDV